MNDSGCFLKCKDNRGLEGAYLYYDLTRHVFIRSGKVAGRDMVVRNDEHLLEAKKDTPSSNLYRLWPSNHSMRAKKRGIKGNFESLLQVVAVGWDPTCEQAKYLDKNWDEGGVLILNEKDKAHIRSSMRNLNCPEIVKFQHMLAYIMELGYDLALCRRSVSKY